MLLGLSGALACAKTRGSGSVPNPAEGGAAAEGGTSAEGGRSSAASAGGMLEGGGTTGEVVPPANLGTAQDATTLWAGGSTSVCWLRKSGELRCTTRSPAEDFMSSACLLDGCEPAREPPLIDLGTAVEVVEVVIGYKHACALLDGGRVKCWGNGGILGLGDAIQRSQPAEMGDALPFLDFGTEQPVVELVAGVNGLHTCARFQDGSVRCWGTNVAGELGLGDEEARGDEPDEMGEALQTVDLGAGLTAVALAAGNASTCALLDTGQVKCWGINDWGQLGLGDNRDRGAAAGEMGDSLPTIDLGSGRSAVAIAAGHAHYCAMLDDGTSKCWGMGGLLGLGDGENRGDDPNEMGDDLPALDLGTDWAAARIVGGAAAHTCAVSSSMSLKCWGENSGNRLGLSDVEKRGDEEGEMGDALAEVAFGDRQLVSIALGSSFSCALFDDDSLACWGLWTVLPNVP
jgi:alpha-tubulin suppressor-like RCC1 family protein